MEFTSNVKEVLNKIIKIDKKISQVELAKLMGVTPGAVTKWLKTGSIETDKIQKLCISLNITPNVLFGLNDDIDVKKALDFYQAFINHPEHQESIRILLNKKN